MMNLTLRIFDIVVYANFLLCTLDIVLMLIAAFKSTNKYGNIIRTATIIFVSLALASFIKALSMQSARLLLHLLAVLNPLVISLVQVHLADFAFTLISDHAKSSSEITLSTRLKLNTRMNVIILTVIQAYITSLIVTYTIFSFISNFDDFYVRLFMLMFFSLLTFVTIYADKVLCKSFINVGSGARLKLLIMAGILFTFLIGFQLYDATVINEHKNIDTNTLVLLITMLIFAPIYVAQTENFEKLILMNVIFSLTSLLFSIMLSASYISYQLTYIINIK